MSTDVIVGLVCIVGGSLICYIVAAHNCNANKKQDYALEAKLSEISAQVKAKVEPTVVVAPAPVAETKPEDQV